MRTAGWNLRDQQVSRVFESYKRALAEANALDFDDLLLKTVELFETSTRAREYYARKFRYILVDEYQDTNRPQYLLMRGWRKCIAICASWVTRISPSTNGGAPTCGTSWTSSATFPDVQIVKLEQNYRSTQVILDAASAVIRRNRNRHDKRLWTDRRGGERIRTCRRRMRSRRPISSPGGSARRSGRTRIAWSPCCTARTPSRAPSRTL